MLLPFMLRQIQFLRKTWIMPAMNAIGIVFSIGLTLSLTPLYGILGAGWAILTSDIIVLIAFALCVQRYERLDFPLAIALVLQAALIALAVWVCLGEPLPSILPHIVFKAVGFIVISAVPILLWVWPKRSFIFQLAAGPARSERS
jgi:O-antigen/teichoic acid export membrane protein